MKSLNWFIIFIISLSLLSCGNSVQPINAYHPSKKPDGTYKYFISLTDVKTGTRIAYHKLLTKNNSSFELNSPVILGTEIKKDMELKITLPYDNYDVSKVHGILKRNHFVIKNIIAKSVTKAQKLDKITFIFKLLNFNLLLDKKKEDTINFNLTLTNKTSQLATTNFAITTAPSLIRIEHLPPLKISEHEIFETIQHNYTGHNDDKYYLVDVIKLTNRSLFPIHTKSSINLKGSLISSTLLYQLRYDTISNYACNVSQTTKKNETILTDGLLILPFKQSDKKTDGLFNQDSYTVTISPEKHQYYLVYSKNFDLENYLHENYPPQVAHSEELQVTCSNRCELPIEKPHQFIEDNPHVDLATVILDETEYDYPEIGPACNKNSTYPKIERYHLHPATVQKGLTNLECFKGRVPGTMTKTFKKGVEDLPITLRIGQNTQVFRASFDRKKIDELGRNLKLIPSQISITY